MEAEGRGGTDQFCALVHDQRVTHVNRRLVVVFAFHQVHFDFTQELGVKRLFYRNFLLDGILEVHNRRVTLRIFMHDRLCSRGRTLQDFVLRADAHR